MFSNNTFVAVEFVNQYLDLSFAVNPSIDSSFGVAKVESGFVYLHFGLNANDCLFDLATNNYEINIRLATTYLDKYNESLQIINDKQTICCNTQAKLLEIINCKLHGIHRKIFLESAVLFLLYQSQKNSLIFQLGCDSCAIVNKPVEVEKVKLAKQYILDNLGNTITIPIIATAVGTNQCYLKKGFKEVYQQTIFEFIQENRMLKAKNILQNTGATVQEVAALVGYASTSSFSQSYKNYFGISPSADIHLSVQSDN
jgi:AraC-like DNA-binding protein